MQHLFEKTKLVMLCLNMIPQWWHPMPWPHPNLSKVTQILKVQMSSVRYFFTSLTLKDQRLFFCMRISHQSKWSIVMLVQRRSQNLGAETFCLLITYLPYGNYFGPIFSILEVCSLGKDVIWVLNEWDKKAASKDDFINNSDVSFVGEALQQ